MNGSNGRVVKGGYSNQKVVSLDLLRFVLFDWKRPKINQKETEDGLFFKKELHRPLSSSIYGEHHNSIGAPST